VSESDIPVQPAARRQHTLQGLSKNTLGRKKPKKTMGTPPGFEKKEEKEEAEDNTQSLRRSPQQTVKKAENASLYPRITLKAETRERTKRGNAIRARQKPRTSPVPPEQAAAGQARDDQRKAARTAHIAAANKRNREERARRKTIGSQSGPVKPEPATPGTAGAENASLYPRTKLQSANLSRKQHAVLREALEILQEATSSGGVGTSMAGSANKCYDADAKPMGKDNVPIADADKSLKKVKKGDKKKAKKKAAKKEEAKMESFDTFLDKVLNDAKEGF